MQAFYKSIASSKKPVRPPSSEGNTQDPTSDPSPVGLNTTYTMDGSDGAVTSDLTAAVQTPDGVKCRSYEMTPADPLANYDIYDLESGDSTDDEDDPKKVLIPSIVRNIPHLKELVL